MVRQQLGIWTGSQPYLKAQPVQAAVDIVVALVLVLALAAALAHAALGARCSTVPAVWLHVDLRRDAAGA